LVVTELTSAEGLARGLAKTLHFLETWPDERPVAAHLYGRDPDVMARAAAVAESLGRFDAIDINAGCPVPKIMRRGEGAGLLRDPAHLQRVVQAVRAAVKLPVTVKTRIGLTPSRVNISEVAQAIEEGGASAIFLHGRVAAQRHAGPPDWDLIAQIKKERRIPIIGNGGVTSADEALRLWRSSGVDGIMIGRAAIGNPWLFAEIAGRLEQRPWTPPAPAERVAMLLEMLEGLVRLAELEQRHRRRCRHTPEASACMQFRAHAALLLRGRPHQRALMIRIMAFTTLAEVRAVLHEIVA
jgi:nifR3 family TIM-barrel protein